jgi:hypothetical protein
MTQLSTPPQDLAHGVEEYQVFFKGSAAVLCPGSTFFGRSRLEVVDIVEHTCSNATVDIAAHWRHVIGPLRGATAVSRTIERGSQ